MLQRAKAFGTVTNPSSQGWPDMKLSEPGRRQGPHIVMGITARLR